MTDLAISAAVVGGKDAIRDLDQIERKTHSASRAVKEFNWQTAKGGSAKRFNLRPDMIPSSDAGSTSMLRRSVAAGTVVGRLGPIGGALGGVAGLAGLGTGFAAIGATLAVTGVAFQALQLSIGKSIERLRDEAEARQSVTHAARDAKKAGNTAALGWLDTHGTTRMALDALGGITARGSTLAKQPGGEEALLRLRKSGADSTSNLSSIDVAMRTGLVTAEEAVKAVLQGAQTSAQIISSALDRVVNGDEVDKMIELAQGGKIGKAVAKVRAMRNEGEDFLEGRATGGAAEKAALDQLRDIRDPNRSLNEIEKAANEQVNLLNGILEQMSGFDQFVDAVINRENSVSAQYNRAAVKAQATGIAVSDTVGAGAGD